MLFPDVQGSNLERQHLSLPDDFEADLNLLLIAFERWHQSSVDSWIPFVEGLEAHRQDLRYYELPVIRELNPLSRWFINEGMRAGIPNQKARRRTVTLYTDKAFFREALDMQDEAEIYLLLVDSTGEVLWRARGPFTPQKAKQLQRALAALEPQGP